MSIFKREPQHRIPKGCHGVASELIIGLDDDLARRGFQGLRAVTGFACPGQSGVQRLHPKSYLDQTREVVVRKHVKEVAVYIAAACAECPIGPAAQLREDLALRDATSKELEKKIELAQLELEIGRQAANNEAQIVSEPTPES